MNACHSFKEFEGFITHKEHTTENLLFCIWFRSYLDRFQSLPSTEQAKVPVPNKKLGERDDPYAYLTSPKKSGGVWSITGGQ